MAKKILATLKNNTQVIVFHEDYDHFSDLISIFEISLSSFEDINYFENMHSKLKDNEKYYIQLNDENKDEILEGVSLNTQTIDMNIITKEQYSQIKYLYLIDDTENKLFFKRVLGTQIIMNKKYLSYETSPKFEEESDKISLNSNVEVIYDINSKRLYFNKLSNLKTILPTVKDLYKLASDDEIKSFFTEDKFNFDQSILVNLNNKNRERLSSLVDRDDIDFTDEELMKKYEQYDEKYKHKLKKIEGKYQIKNKPQLMNLMEVLEERYYKTPITNEKREADAFRKVN